MNKKNLVLILIIILISGISTYLYFNKTKSVSTKPIDTVTTSDPIYKIPELGIQIELPDSLSSDLIYKVMGIPGNSDVNIEFGTQSITKIDPGCSVESHPLGILSKTYGKYPEVANIENARGELVKQFADFYISYTHPQEVCMNPIQTKESFNLLYSQLKDFGSALPTIIEY